VNVTNKPIRDYRDIVAWQRAMDLAVSVDVICDRLPRKSWELASQMRRAANSVHSCIAEGNGRFSTADYLRHLAMSNASLNELESDLFFLERRETQLDAVRQALQLSVEVRRPLWGLIKALRRKGNES
jgi:four helix bundle protein